MRLVFASVLSLCALGALLLGILLLALVFTVNETASLVVILVSVLVINVVIWLLGPIFMDFIQGLIYKIKTIPIEDLEPKNPQCVNIIRKITAKYGYKIPKIRIIQDQNPTAYTYGSGRYNARLVFSEGLFHYLSDEEAATVVAHELGHITRRDFIIMSLASTFLQCLYALYVLFTRSRNDDNKSRLAAVGALAYFFYIIGQYILLYLSRVREYGADLFAVRETQNPNGLASALLKIAYGIAQESEKGSDNRLLKGTQTLGICSLKNADQASSLRQNQAGKDFQLPEASITRKILTFDFVSIWAQLSEWLSTHPLTGKRIKHISQFCSEYRQTPLVDFDSLGQDIALYKAEARQAFFRDVLVWMGPMIALVVYIVAFVQQRTDILIAAAVAFLVFGFYKIWYRYPTIEETESQKDYLGLMQDFTASPLRGIPTSLKGTVVGRGIAGSYFSEDFLLHTRSGIVLANYQSIIPFLGNLFAALGKTRKLIKEKASISATGWFFRANTRWIDLARVTPDTQVMKKFRSHPIFPRIVAHLVVSGIMIGIVVLTIQGQSISWPF